MMYTWGYYTSTGLLVQSVYQPSKALSSGWWVFHAVVSLITCWVVTTVVAAEFHAVWRRAAQAREKIARARREGAAGDVGERGEKSRGGDECGEDEKSARAESGPGHHVESSPSSPILQDHKPRGNESEEERPSKWAHISEIFFYLLASVMVGCNMWFDWCMVHTAPGNMNGHFSFWFWMRWSLAVYLVVAHVVMILALVATTYVNRRWAKPGSREGSWNLPEWEV